MNDWRENSEGFEHENKRKGGWAQDGNSKLGKIPHRRNKKCEKTVE
jgi:hypothetical protein